MATGTESNGVQPRKTGKLTQLYLGTGGFNIVGKRKIWYAATAVILLVCLGSFIFRGFTPSIEFVGGTKIQMPATSVEGTITADEAKRVYADTLGHDPVASQNVGSGATASVEIRSETLSNAQVSELKDALFEDLQPVGNDGQPSRDTISDRGLSGSWGGEITDKALLALAVFLVLVTAFLVFYFERWMAVAALAALGFDLTVSAGVYSLVGFEVTPATVIGLLTILGFSLYDTVVVFDKVKENTKGLVNLSRQTYPEAANLALNQTLMRSINTSVVALLPVLGLLVIGAGLLGAGTLKDLALIMTIGTLSGTISSVFLATPVLVDLKMREPAYQEQARKVESRRALGKRTVSQQAGVDGAAASTVDDEALDAELRQEKAYAAASSVPGRNLKKVDQRRVAGKPSGKSPAGKRTGKPSGKPTGKRKR
jgi:preprotein translocase subunit SecF